MTLYVIISLHFFYKSTQEQFVIFKLTITCFFLFHPYIEVSYYWDANMINVFVFPISDIAHSCPANLYTNILNCQQRFQRLENNNVLFPLLK